MAAYTIMHRITTPYTATLALPAARITALVGYRPKSIVMYTHRGDYVVNLDENYELKNPDLQSLLTNLIMQDGEFMEIVSYSNTDYIVRVYDDLGYEKNCALSPITHTSWHFRVELEGNNRDSLVVVSTFNNGFFGTGPGIYVLKSNLGACVVQGTSLGVYGGSGVKFSGDGWLAFYRMHALRRGMVLVFQHVRGTIFNMFFYRSDGSEMGHCTGVPSDFGASSPEILAGSLYKILTVDEFCGDEMRLFSAFARANLHRLKQKLQLRTAAGDFYMNYIVEPYQLSWNSPILLRRYIKGNWQSVFQANQFQPSPYVKFKLSLNSPSYGRFGDECTMFALEFVTTGDAGGQWPEHSNEDTEREDEGVEAEGEDFNHDD